MTEAILTLESVTKSFAGVHALTHGALELRAGEVTALIGENGAGKSTLVKILTGVYRPDGGTIRLRGQPVAVTSAAHARSLGITAIHQEAVVFDDLTVAENIFIEDRPRTRLGAVDWALMATRSRAILKELESDLDPTTPMRQLSVAQKHLVQIARALSVDARVVIMDEPTAALSHREIEDLLAIVRRLRAEGRAILFISHKFDEIEAIADSYAVFRDGAAVGAGRLAQTSRDELVALMVGRPVGQVFPKTEAKIGPPVLEAQGLTRLPEFEGIDFTLRRGEILGIYGLVGSGRSEMARAIFGVSQLGAGHLLLDGQAVRFAHPGQAIKAGIAYVPEDRQSQGAVLTLPIFQNVTLARLGHYAKAGFLSGRKERKTASILAQAMQLKAASLDQNVEELSGGNQQKVVIAKWLATDPKVLILDEPTKGIDVGSKAAVHRFMGALVRQGLAILMISSELPEVMGMADRILVMRRGRSVGLFERATATPETIIRAATDA
ncbi:rhamnose ABC transporter ATP-binding protein [Arboricoccus pini]|uniref:Rhamnose ABC transporter ATP-binding protein n=1 Tax=Arboricoccus pini TaxID=1963835 RepID=A0A212RXG0_9PROT|nr:sugar ABC transporter ATP-binding protein [Arboricoccus pini]SNB77385.1 rhamnose ABC transporter ATP-binding protein [Arboricoccus pini]